MRKWDNPPEAVWVWGKYGKYEETYCHAEEIKQEEFEVPVTKYVRADRIAALEAQLAERVKVKPLEWRDKSGSEYEVRWDGIGIGVHYVAKAVKCGDLILCCGKYHTDINEAKAAAQADYDRRILFALEATPPAPKVTEWREITEDDQPPRDVPVLMGCWEKWPRDEWVVEFGLYGSTKGGWIHGRMTHWLPSSFLPSAPTLTAAQEAGKP